MNGFKVAPTTPVICVIDGDPAVRDSLSYLCDSAGHTAVGFATAAAFLRDLDQLLALCIICEERLPDVSGLHLFREVKQRGIDVPFALLVSRDGPTEVEAASRAGVDVVWTKPMMDENNLLNLLDRNT